jgi:hypothetical protein
MYIPAKHRTLTLHIKDPNSPVTKFLKEYFPNIPVVTKEIKFQVENPDTIRPADVNKYPYTTIGTAIDYRIRYYFAITPVEDLVAHNLIKTSSDNKTTVYSTSLNPDLIDEFFGSLDDKLEHLRPVGRELERVDEELIARYCYVLALFEAAWRGGTDFADPKCATVADLLNIAQPHSVDDMCNLSWLFHKCHGNLTSSKAILNPTFDGSRDIAADADLIIDDYLIEIKTTVNPTSITRQGLYQLIGYVLLDYSNRYKLRGVGFYMARQGLLLKWELSEFLTKITGQKNPSLVDLRTRFENLLEEMRKIRKIEKMRIERERHEREEKETRKRRRGKANYSRELLKSELHRQLFDSLSACREDYKRLNPHFFEVTDKFHDCVACSETYFRVNLENECDIPEHQKLRKHFEAHYEEYFDIINSINRDVDKQMPSRWRDISSQIISEKISKRLQKPVERARKFLEEYEKENPQWKR